MDDPDYPPEAVNSNIIVEEIEMNGRVQKIYKKTYYLIDGKTINITRMEQAWLKITVKSKYKLFINLYNNYSFKLKKCSWGFGVLGFFERFFCGIFGWLICGIFG